MATVSFDQRIRKGLISLSRADKVVIRAAVPLARLTGEANPPGILDLLDEFSFNVDGNTYCGEMTQAQCTYLQGYTSSLKDFAYAVTRVLIQSHHEVLDAITDLSAALDAPKVANKAGVGKVAVCNEQ